MAIGPGAVEIRNDNPQPLLQNVTDNDIIQVFNPLSEDFAARVAVDRPVNQPLEPRQTPGLEQATRNEGDLQRNYGVERNPNHPSVAHVSTTVILPAGKITNLMGGTARVAVHQLVTEIMQREDNTLKMADPHARLEVEERVVMGRQSVQDLMASQPLQTPQEQVRAAINNLNEGANNEEQAFPTITGGATSEEDSGSTDTVEASGAKRRGRPAKAQP